MRILLLLTLILSGILPCYAQPRQAGGADGAVLLTAETLAADTLVDLSTVLWRFHEGDDPAWAAPAFNDSAWALIDTDFRPDSLYPDLWQGLGWFRLHLRVDAALHDTILGLYTYHAGASEIYLDGQKIGGFGEIGATAEDDQTYTPRGLPLSFHLDDRDAHVLAVRYANRALSSWAFDGYGRSTYIPAGFALVVGPNTAMMRSYAFEKGMLYNDALIMGLLVSILILHLLLYLFDRRDRANLFYALAVFFLCIAHFCGHASGYRVLVVDGSWNLVLLDQILSQSFILFVFLLLATLYTLFAPRLLRWLGIPFVLWLVWASFWYASGTLVPYLGFLIPMLLLLFEAVRVSFYAVYQRKEGAWILGAALLFSFVVILFMVFVYEPVAGRSYLVETPSLIGAGGILLFLFFVPVPIGMTVLLARRFARRSRRLERELDRVEELSARTIAQEREKQALIASQNERLEAEVAERTVEIEAARREVTRQAALDRVRAEIASMRTADDLRRITPLIWRELTTLSVPFFRCGVFIIDEAQETVQVFLTTPEGKALAVLPLDFDATPLVTALVAHWRQEAVYTETWDAERMQAWTAFLAERRLITAPGRYLDGAAPPEHLALHFVPFAQGMLYVGNTDPLTTEHRETVQALADAFAVAYARYEDFRRLEAKNREVEEAMANLKAAQQQLVQQEKMASLGQLTAGIAHEIKNPLNFINNFAEVNTELADELREALANGESVDDLLADLKQNAEVIAQHGKRADGIVKSMMAHAREGKGEREVVDLNALIDEHVELAYHGKRAQTPGFNVEIQRDYDAAVGPVMVVPQDLGRVMLNLVGNAFDAVMEHAGRVNGQYVPTMTVATRQVDGQVEIRVEDNGPGIPAEIGAKIFEPFFTTKPAGSGTGLGLSLSYDIVTQGHGGILAVESEEGKGTTFVVRLPPH